MSDEWTDEKFLQYVETHSQTPRALFSDVHVRRLCRLAGREEPPISGFLAVHYETAKPLIDAARKRLACPHGKVPPCGQCDAQAWAERDVD